MKKWILLTRRLILVPGLDVVEACCLLYTDASIVGIILNTIGTLFTLWTIFSTRSSMAGNMPLHDFATSPIGISRVFKEDWKSR